MEPSPSDPIADFRAVVFDEDLQQKRSAHWLHRMRGGQPDLGCCLRRVAGALPPLLRVLRFQLSFQSLPGITTMAISAEIYPTMVRGTAAGISAACGKLGATVGSYVFSELKNLSEIRGIFWSVFATSALATLLTALSTPYYNGSTLDSADKLARDGKPRQALKILYSGPIANQDRTKGVEYVADDLSDGADEQRA